MKYELELARIFASEYVSRQRALEYLIENTPNYMNPDDQIDYDKFEWASYFIIVNYTKAFRKSNVYGQLSIGRCVNNDKSLIALHQYIRKIVDKHYVHCDGNMFDNQTGHVVEDEVKTIQSQKCLPSIDLTFWKNFKVLHEEVNAYLRKIIYNAPSNPLCDEKKSMLKLHEPSGGEK